MNTVSKKTIFRQVFELILIVTVVVYIIPAVKDTIFPTKMDRFEKMLRKASMQGYRLAVDRKSKSEIVLTVYDGDNSITVQIYRDVLREIEPVNRFRIFFSHAINDNSEQVVYLSRVRMETDEDLKTLHRLEVTVCGRIQDQTGKVSYDDHEPIYECEVPIQKITTSARE